MHANGPAISSEVYSIFHKLGIIDVNDFIVNKGGVVVSYEELLQPETLLIESVGRVLERVLPPITVTLEVTNNHISEKMEERKRFRGY
jgi:glutamate dehydrogenase/leucine dehydrogenase